MKRLYGLIGYPLTHSFSKKYFTQKFEKEGLTDCFFELFPLEQIEQFNSLPTQNSRLMGLAVTIPHKQAIIPFLDELSEEALQIGAVNCIKFTGGKLIGYNTDALGFKKSIAPLLLPHHKKALVLGTGGASKAVTYILQQLQIAYLLVSRKPSKSAIGYNDITADLLNQYPLIINCTPVGMTPNENEQPSIPYQFITPQHLCYDLIYKPAISNFLSLAKARGATIKNGFEMLCLQAEENWTIWNQ